MINKKEFGKIIQIVPFYLIFTWLNISNLFAAGNTGMDSVKLVQQQSITVSGKVTDTDGKPLIGVNVSVKGTQIVTVTNVDGKYSINVPNTNVVLSFSYIGYRTYDITVLDKRIINVELTNDLQQMNEVVVTGFGDLKKFHSDGSTSMIKADNTEGMPNRTVASMIQANAPGVAVNTTSSQPGGVSTIRVRGYGSYSASNSPLLVIDGVPVISGDINSTGRSGSLGGGTEIMSTLNPSDISNITIIKDAAAASLWGSRAANGVILITTKQGSKNKPRISFSSDFGGSDFAYNYRPVMGGEERRQFIYDSYVRQGMYVNKLSEADAIAYANGMAKADSSRDIPRWAVAPWSGWTDWRTEAFRKGSQNNQELSVSGGSDKMTYYTSFSHTNSKGIQKIADLDRYTGRVNVKYDAKKWLRLGDNLMFSDMKQGLGYDENWYTSPMYAAFIKNTPSDAVYNKDGTFNTVLIGGTSRNIVPFYKYNKNQQQVTRAFNTMYMELTPLPELTLKSTYSYDFTLSRGDKWDHPINANQPTLNGTTDKIYDEYRRRIWSSNVNYVKTLGNNHNLDALLAFEVMDSYDNSLNGQATGFLNYDYTEIGNGSVPVSVGGYFSQDRMVSYISRANYNWKYKYYVGGSFRRDGTSRLHPSSRWGNFWSVSAGWKFTEEDFMKSISDLITNGKLRVSYGVNGNRPSGSYSYLSLASTNSYNGGTALMAGNIANEKLVWEGNYTLNTGLDLSIKNRVDLTVELYDRTTKNLFMNLPVSRTTGFSSYTTNIGSMRNRGVEFTVNTQNIKRKDLTWNTQFNISHNKNAILEMDGTDADVISSYTIRRKGLPLYQYYVIEFSHINPENGRAMFFMNNKLPDGTINRAVTDDGSKATRIPYKSPFPTAIIGFSNNFKWKLLDLSFTFSSTLGGYSYDRAGDKTENSGAADALINQIPTFYRDSWKKPGDNAQYEAWIPGTSTTYSMGAYHNSRRIHSTDHIRLKNLSAGISMPKEWTNAMKVNQLRVYFTGQNLWTLAAYKGYDPEVPDDGSMWYNTPPLKSYSFGINLTL
ncbi:SusC/RagA family TonB-linked outer membrane protein [Chitinophaga sp. 30R24]|uniref:SusC/RagA family TonB-linked outer membrane protein n=1 Tax=Chitinophaga sp. 30R24 TaxID=3248838 RepID=UPI003B9081C2